MSEGRGGRNGAAGGTRALSSALRSAGIGGGSDDRMELDGGVGRAGGRHKRTGARSAGPLDQVSTAFMLSQVLLPHYPR